MVVASGGKRGVVRIHNLVRRLKTLAPLMHLLHNRLKGDGCRFREMGFRNQVIDDKNIV